MFNNLFFQTKALPELSSQLDAEIPRYPSFLKGCQLRCWHEVKSRQNLNHKKRPRTP